MKQISLRSKYLRPKAKDGDAILKNDDLTYEYIPKQYIPEAFQASSAFDKYKKGESYIFPLSASDDYKLYKQEKEQYNTKTEREKQINDIKNRRMNQLFGQVEKNNAFLNRQTIQDAIERNNVDISLPYFNIQVPKFLDTYTAKEQEKEEIEEPSIISKLFSTQGLDKIKEIIGYNGKDIKTNNQHKQFVDNLRGRLPLGILNRFNEEQRLRLLGEYNKALQDAAAYNENPVNYYKNQVQGVVNLDTANFSFRNRNQAKNQQGYDILAPWNNFELFDNYKDNPNIFPKNVRVDKNPKIGNIEQYPGYIGLRNGKLFVTNDLNDFQKGDYITKTYYSDFDDMSDTEYRMEQNNSNQWSEARQIRLKKNIEGKLVDADALTSYWYSNGSPNSAEQPQTAIIQGITDKGDKKTIIIYGQSKDGMIQKFRAFKQKMPKGTKFRYYSVDSGYNKKSYIRNNSARHIGYPSLILK